MLHVSIVWLVSDHFWSEEWLRCQQYIAPWRRDYPTVQQCNLPAQTCLPLFEEHQFGNMQWPILNKPIREP